MLLRRPDYLFSPVTEYNASSWEVYLPKFTSVDGAEHGKWVHHYTNQSYTGGQSVTIDVRDLDTFPLFRRTPSKYATV